MLITQFIFWLSVLALSYIYFGYPILIWALSANSAPRPTSCKFSSTVSIVVVAHNESKRIGQRIENLLALDYPSHLLDIVIASDGSTDDTVKQASRYKDRGVRVVEFGKNRGKPAVLNDLIPGLKSEIVVFADARQSIPPESLQMLLANFTDPEVGAVSGELILESDPHGHVGEGVGFYWRYEKFIRRCESGVDSMIGATGAYYAIRRRLYREIPEETILDDVLIPMLIVRQGYRVVQEGGAVAYDKIFNTSKAEFSRKVRTIAGNFQLFSLAPWLLNPAVNRLWFQTFSHKLLRLLSPLFLIIVLASNYWLLDILLYQVLIAIQFLFYSAATFGYLLRSYATKGPLLNVPYAFCLLNWATVVGSLRYFSGRQRVTWEKAEG